MTAQELWAEYRPKLDAARDRDRKEQQGVFLSVPENVGGVWLEPLTIERFLLLDGIDHPMLTGRGVTPECVASFCYILSPEYRHGDQKAARDFIKSFSPPDAKQFADQLAEYVQDQFDLGGADSKKENQGGAGESWVCSTIDLLASEYSWSEQEILRLPIKRAFTYARAIVSRKSESNVATFSKHQDRVKSEYLESMAKIRNEKNGE